MDLIFQDVRYALRSLRRSPGSTIVIVLTLALAMGTSAVLFTVIDTVLQSVPAQDRSRVVSVSSTDPQRGRRRIGASPADFLDWKARSRSFESLGAMTFGTFNLTGIDTPLRVRTARASVDIFPALGIEPPIGRTFKFDEDRAGGNHVALLSKRFWQRQFDGDPAALERTIILDGEHYAVVGVMPARVEIGALRQVDLWLPLAIDSAAATRDQRSLYVFGRLKPGVTRRQSGAEMATIGGQLSQMYPTTNSGIGIVVEPAIEAFGGGGVRFVLRLLFLMAALLIVVACANVANVILARAAGRRREFAVRAAIGAGRSALMRQLLIEDGMLSVLGGAAGLLLCTWEVDAVRAIAGTEMPIFSAMTVDTNVLLFALAIVVIAPFVFGFLPALRAAAPDLREGLKDGARSVAGNLRARRVRAILVGSQVAVAVVVLVEVGALVRTALLLRSTERGFDATNLLTVRIDLPESKYRDPDRAHQFFDTLTQRLAGLPGVRGAAAIDRLPIADRERPVRFTIEGRPAPPTGEEPWAAIASVSPSYFRTMLIPLVGGRELSSADSADAGAVALVSRLAAIRYWPRGDAVGHRVRLATDDMGGRWIDVVGIVGDVRNSDSDAGPIPQIYLPHAQRSSRAMAIVVRGANIDVESLAGTIRREVVALDRDQPIYDVKTMDRVLFEDLADIYILVSMLVALAGIALGLAATGTYGVIAYGVTQRTSEIGVRMALGAEAADVVRMVVTQGLAPVIVGACIGFAFGFALVRVTTSALEEVTSRGLTTYLVVAVLVGAVTLLASYLPARRATRIDPMAALRAE
jgi:putative ABC transport system permease protein